MKKLLPGLLISLFLFNCSHTRKNGFPFWAKDLIIYEVAIKGFTSPAGPETGCFKSLKEKMQYLHEVGFNGIWLSGHNWANDHFYGIWTEYAAIRQDSIDSSLGTRVEFKAMIDEAHKYNIKIFLDVITHGVVEGSPLIKEHPDWFKGGSWGMKDFDWFGNHKDLDEWWVKTWLRYVLEFGIDGFRLDCDIYRPDLWGKIKQSARNKGKEIIIFEEGPVLFPGVTDSRQYSINCASHEGLVKNYPFVVNVAAHLNELSGYGANTYNFIICYKNRKSDTLQRGDNRILTIGYSDKTISSPGMSSYHEFKTEVKILMPGNTDSITGVKSSRFTNGLQFWDTHWWISLEDKNAHPNWPHATRNGDTLIVNIPEVDPKSVLAFNQISCHDNGWEGFPADQNPYSVHGSRCVMGYSGILTPTVPVFFAGEEFIATYHALPKLMPTLYGDKGNAGDGRWLYGCMIDWNDTALKDKKEFLEDVKKMITIRKAERDLINGYAIQSGCRIWPLSYTCQDTIPNPFIIFNDKKAIVVAGNNLQKHISCLINIPSEVFPEAEKFILSDLWNNEKRTITKKEFSSFKIDIKSDAAKGGGLAVIKIEPVK